MKTHFALLAAITLLSPATSMLADEAPAESARPARSDAADEKSPAAGEAKPAPKSTAIAVGTTAPMMDVALMGVGGKTASISQVKGEKGTLVLFMCNHCPYVKAWLDRIVKIGNKSPHAGIGVIAINANDPAVVAGDGLEAMQELAKEKSFEFPYVVDQGSKVARAFGAGRTPEAFLLDANGVVVYHGAIDDNAEDATAVTQRYLANAIEALVAGKEIELKETKAIGCSIKFAPQS